MILTVELVPKTSWGHNVRTLVSRKTWDVIRRKCYRLAGNRCEICGGVGKRHPVECHEIWEYDDENHTQTLTGFLALCPNCHRVKHLGKTFQMGLGLQAMKHMVNVNVLPLEEIRDYCDDVFAKWMDRSRYEWKVDISYINSYMET